MLISKNEITQILPHRFPMIMVDELIQHTATHTQTCFTVEATNIFVQNGYFQEAGLIENMAQTAAAGTGYLALQNNQPAPVGFIAAVQHLEIMALPEIGSKLQTEITVTNQVFDFTFVSGTIHLYGSLVARADFKIFIPKMPEQ